MEQDNCQGVDKGDIVKILKAYEDDDKIYVGKFFQVFDLVDEPKLLNIPLNNPDEKRRPDRN